MLLWQTREALDTASKSLHRPSCSPSTTGLPAPEPVHCPEPGRWHPSSSDTDSPSPPGTPGSSFPSPRRPLEDQPGDAASHSRVICWISTRPPSPGAPAAAWNSRKEPRPFPGEHGAPSREQLPAGAFTPASRARGGTSSHQLCSLRGSSTFPRKVSIQQELFNGTRDLSVLSPSLGGPAGTSPHGHRRAAPAEPQLPPQPPCPAVGSQPVLEEAGNVST